MTIYGTDSGAIGVYVWSSDFARTPGGVESYAGHLVRHLVDAGVPVVVHCMAGDTAGWHVRDGEFQVGGRLIEPEPHLVVHLPAHGPGLEGAIAENLDVARRFGERTVLAFGTRDGYVFDVAAAVAAGIDVPSVAFYYHSADERRYRAQFTTRGAGVPGVASALERAAFEDDVVAAVLRIAADFTATVVPTEYVRGQFSTVVPPALMTKVLVAYHGPAAAAFPPRRTPWDGSGAWLHVSRCSVPNALHKNFTWSCEFLRYAVREGRPPSHLAQLELCGSGNAEPLVRAFAEANGLSDRIRVTGLLDQSRLAAKYREAAFLLVPSMMEAGCTVIVEAVLSGCVPIVLDHAGSGEVMRRLRLDRFLVRGVPRRFPVSGLDTTVDSVEPDMDAALDLVQRCLADPPGTFESLRAASEVARAEFSLEPTLAVLETGLRRLGVTLGSPR